MSRLIFDSVLLPEEINRCVDDKTYRKICEFAHEGHRQALIDKCRLYDLNYGKQSSFTNSNETQVETKVRYILRNYKLPSKDYKNIITSELVFPEDLDFVELCLENGFDINKIKTYENVIRSIRKHSYESRQFFVQKGTFKEIEYLANEIFNISCSHILLNKIFTIYTLRPELFKKKTKVLN